MDTEARRDLELLEAVAGDPRITQRRLASRLGIALGLTNAYLKRLVHKGYIKCVTIPSNRLVYLMTPSGIARKAWLTYEFMQHSLDLYRDARQHLRQVLGDSIASGHERVALYGTGDAAELAYLSLRELGLEPVAVFDGEADHQFLGLPVRSIREHDQVQYDLMIIATLKPPASVVKRLVKYGVAREKMVTLRE
jgi:DNA-binding Lrp family transcriptional regulator